MTHIWGGNLTIIVSDNGLSPDQRQAIIWTNSRNLLIGLFEWNFSEISIRIDTFSSKQIQLKMSSAKWRPFCLGLIVLKMWVTSTKTNSVYISWDMLHIHLILMKKLTPGGHTKTYILVSLVEVWCQAITSTNSDLLSIRHNGTCFN